MKSALKPPRQCPVCGEPRQKAVAEWGRFPGRRGRSIIIPVVLIAVYFCGATIEARYVPRPAFGIFAGRYAGAEWKTEVTQGCLAVTRDHFDRSIHAPAAPAAGARV